MTKKRFTNSFEEIFTSNPAEESSGESNKKEVKPIRTKATYYYNTETLDLIKMIAYYERENIGDILETALKSFISGYSRLKEAKSEYEHRNKK